MFPNAPSISSRPAIHQNLIIYTSLLLPPSNLNHQHRHTTPAHQSAFEMECKALTSKKLRNPCERNPTTISLLEGEETFFNRLLSKDSSKGFSSRIYYRVPGNVPFEWEKQPGKPKVLSESAPQLCPLSPPPAMLSVHTSPIRCIHLESKGSTQRRLWFWKKKKGAKAQKSQSLSHPVSNESFESWSSEGDSTWSSSSSPRNSSSLLSSSSSSGSLGTPMGKLSGPVDGKMVKDLRKGRRKEGLEWVWSCSAWGTFPCVLVCMVPEA